VARSGQPHPGPLPALRPRPRTYPPPPLAPGSPSGRPPPTLRAPVRPSSPGQPPQNPRGGVRTGPATMMQGLEGVRNFQSSRKASRTAKSSLGIGERGPGLDRGRVRRPQLAWASAVGWGAVGEFGWAGSPFPGLYSQLKFAPVRVWGWPLWPVSPRPSGLATPPHPHREPDTYSQIGMEKTDAGRKPEPHPLCGGNPERPAGFLRAS
jgi:hypothetical protein